MLDTDEIIHRELPAPPPEAYSSPIRRLVARLHNHFKRSQSCPVGSRTSCMPNRSSGTGDGVRKKPHERNIYLETPLPNSKYYALINNHVSYVLPGLRERPPPPEDDDSHEIVPYRAVAGRSAVYQDYTRIEALSRPNQSESEEPEEEAPTLPPRPPVKRSTSSMMSSVQSLHHKGWYWGPLDRAETERRLKDAADGSFLVRDSSDQHHLYALSFKQGGRIMHTRIEFYNGLFTFHTNPRQALLHGKPSVEELIETGITGGLKGQFSSPENNDNNNAARGNNYIAGGNNYAARGNNNPVQANNNPARANNPARVSNIRIQLKHPISRHDNVKSLQFLCKFVLRANMNYQRVEDLPLPGHVKSWVAEKQYFTS